MMNTLNTSITEVSGLTCISCNTPTIDCVTVAYAPNITMRLIHPELHSTHLSCFNLSDGEYYFIEFGSSTGKYSSAVVFYSVRLSPGEGQFTAAAASGIYTYIEKASCPLCLPMGDVG